MSTNYNKLLAGYNQMWETGQVDLVNGCAEADSVPDASSKRWGISAVLRLPPSYSDSLQPTIDDLRQCIGEHHTFYAPDTLHVTLRSIEFFRLAISDQDKAVSAYRQLLVELVRSAKPLAIAFNGLSANRVGVILQGFPVDDQLQDLRQQFHQALKANGFLEGPEAEQPRYNAHASLVVYGGSLENAIALTRYVEQHRTTDYGLTVLNQVDLVRYERSLAQVKLITLDRFALGE